MSTTQSLTEIRAEAKRTLQDAEHTLQRIRAREDYPSSKDGGSVYASMVADGVVEGYASTWDRDPDSYGDIVRRGAFADTLRAWKLRSQPIPLLYGHRTDDPAYNIGRVVDAHEDARGLFIRAEFDADNPTAQEVRKLAKQGRLFQFSFAYRVLDSGPVTLPDGTTANELRKLDLYECSLVQVPANQHAVVTAVKDGAPVGTDVRLELAKARATVDALREASRILTDYYERELDQARAKVRGYQLLMGMGPGE